MKLIIADDYEELSRRAARIIARQIMLRPISVLAMPTGDTPLGMYRELARMATEGLISFSAVITFNLDEYRGLPPEHPQSYYRYMHEHLFENIDIQEQNVHIPNGLAQDVEAECRRYDAEICKHGGIDLQVLGIGVNGHIGFNEPGSDWGMSTTLVKLSEETRQQELRHFSRLEDVPTQALTMGIKTIMHARKILLLATGREKAPAVRAALRGPIVKEVPASVLQLHPQMTVLLDREASTLL
jgi:glucosamine-6-phosphate deaminase